MIALRKGSIIGGRYRVEFMIGRGGMGTVYGVRHMNTEEKLALKLLHPALAENEAAVERFRTEAKAPVRIESEHVVRVVDADIATELNGVPFMIMERLIGHDLRSELKRRGALPAGEVVLYLTQVARALDKAHKQGIIHRDLKPANMYIVKREDGSPLIKVLDFGIAKLTDDAAKELTVAGQVFGTPWYMAPEQARGDLGRVGPATDLWAVGLIAYQFLTGRNYWTADGMAALVGQICYEPMVVPSEVAPHLGPMFDTWFAQACHREPSQRFGSAKEMVMALAQALGVDHSTGVTTGSGHHANHDGMHLSGPGASAPGYRGIPGMAMGQSLGPGGSIPGTAGVSALGISAPGVTGPGALVPGTPAPGLSAAGLPGPGISAPGISAPGISAAGVHLMEATAAPLYSTKSPSSKSGVATAVVLGVVIALVIGGTGVGVWMVMPRGTAADATPAKTVDTASPAAPQPTVPPSETPAPTAVAVPSTSPEASASASSGTSDTSSTPGTTAAPPKTPPRPSRGKVRRPPKEQPKTPPKAAPKVGEVDF